MVKKVDGGTTMNNMENAKECVKNNVNEVDLAKELGIVEVKVDSEDGLVFFAGCHCSNGNKSVVQLF